MVGADVEHRVLAVKHADRLDGTFSILTGPSSTAIKSLVRPSSAASLARSGIAVSIRGHFQQDPVL